MKDEADVENIKSQLNSVEQFKNMQIFLLSQFFNFFLTF